MSAGFLIVLVPDLNNGQLGFHVADTDGAVSFRSRVSVLTRVDSCSPLAGAHQPVAQSPGQAAIRCSGRVGRYSCIRALRHSGGNQAGGRVGSKQTTQVLCAEPVYAKIAAKAGTRASCSFMPH